MNTKKLNDEVYSIEISNVLDDINMQTKIIRLYLDEKPDFREQVRDIIKLDYFESSMHKFILKYVIKYIDDYEKSPTIDSLKLLVKSQLRDKSQLESMYQLVEFIYNYDIEKDKEFVFDVTLDFFKKQYLKKVLFKAAEQFDIGSFGEISVTIDNALKKFEPKSKSHEYLDVKCIEKRLEEEARNPIACLEGLDHIIGGGLSSGELAIILSPTGGGKSMLLVKVAAEALAEGKKVIYYTLELAGEAIGRRFDACLNNIPIKFVSAHKESIIRNSKRLADKGGALFIQPYLESKPTITTLKNHLAQLKRDNQFVPDVIIVDYADLMKPTTHYSEKRYALTDIYEGLRNLANEMNVPVWTASQVNRGGYENKDFSLANIAEDIGKANTADLILGIVRTKQNKMSNTAKIQIMKNRNGQEGGELDCIFNTSKVEIKVISVDATGKPNFEGLNVDGAALERQINQQ